MNKLLSISFLLLLVIGFSGCVQNANNQNVKKELILKTFLDEFAAQNPDCLNNDITKEECTKKLEQEIQQKLFGDSIPALTQLRMEFKHLWEEDGDQYLAEFACGNRLNGYSISDDYEMAIRAYSLVDKETALQLKEGKAYHIKGACHKFHNGILDYVEITDIGKADYNLGGLLITDLSFTLAD